MFATRFALGQGLAFLLWSPAENGAFVQKDGFVRRAHEVAAPGEARY
jgi:hypothetical protein